MKVSVEQHTSSYRSKTRVHTAIRDILEDLFVLPPMRVLYEEASVLRSKLPSSHVAF